jgi:uncharacterized HAD superfamily protein
MELNKNNFYQTLESFVSIPEKICNVTEESFRKTYASDEAKRKSNIVYLWRCEKNIQRLKGESNILYIGQTKHSFSRRYLPHAKLHANSQANILKFNHIIDNYGSISISICEYSKFGDTLQEAEGQLLWWYFQNHLEYPPINYTKTKVRNNFLIL